MLIDIFITYKDRDKLFERSLQSFIENTPKNLYRLTVVCDGHGEPDWLQEFWQVDYILKNKENMGLGPSINHAISHIDNLNKWYETSPLEEDKKKVSDFICYCQDDLLYSEGWLEKLTKMFLLFEQPKKLGFASGIECVEHEVKEKVGDIVFKDWIRAAQIYGKREYWMSMFPIPAYDPETGRKRAKPNNGMGSGVDWHFIRNHPNSVCKAGKTCLVIPGLCKHMGFKNSTWLDRNLPESEEDKKEIEKILYSM